MVKAKLSYKEQTFGPQRALNLKSRLYVLLRDELGLGKQPKVAHLLVDEIIAVVESTLVASEHLKPGQVLLLAPKIGQGPSWGSRRLEDQKLTSVLLTLIDTNDIDRLASGEPIHQVRLKRLIRLVTQAYEQGATLSACQLALMTNISPGQVSHQLSKYMEETGEVLPIRGIVEDYSPAISHKKVIIRRHLAGHCTSEIARATHHTPRSVERYIRRFEQVRELARYLGTNPDVEVMARILGCSANLVRTYLELIPMDGVDNSNDQTSR